MKKLSLLVAGIAVFGIAAAASFNKDVAKSDSEQQADCWNNPNLTGAPTLVQSRDCPTLEQTCCYKRSNPDDPTSPIVAFHRDAI